MPSRARATSSPTANVSDVRGKPLITTAMRALMRRTVTVRIRSSWALGLPVFGHKRLEQLGRIETVQVTSLLGRGQQAEDRVPAQELLRGAVLGDLSGDHHGNAVGSASQLDRVRDQDRRASLDQAVESRSEEHTSELQSRRDLVCRL